MSESGSKQHNRLAAAFVQTVAAETSDYAELMVVVESTVLSAMLIMRRFYGLSPATCVELAETAIQQSTERFAALEEGKQ